MTALHSSLHLPFLRSELGGHVWKMVAIATNPKLTSNKPDVPNLRQTTHQKNQKQKQKHTNNYINYSTVSSETTKTKDPQKRPPKTHSSRLTLLAEEISEASEVKPAGANRQTGNLLGWKIFSEDLGGLEFGGVLGGWVLEVFGAWALRRFGFCAFLGAVCFRSSLFLLFVVSVLLVLLVLSSFEVPI